MCLLIPIMKSSIKSNRRISLSRDEPFSWLCSVCSTSVSIHAPRAGCDLRICPLHRPVVVSIHVPRVGCDILDTDKILPRRRFNPRTPGGVRPLILFAVVIEQLFQSTHPGRGATTISHVTSKQHRSFNPRTPGGVRRTSFEDTWKLTDVSIHAPRAGCDISW